VGSRSVRRLFIYTATNEWQAALGNSPVAGGRRNELSAAGAKLTERLRQKGASLVRYKVTFILFLGIMYILQECSPWFSAMQSGFSITYGACF